MNPQTKLFDITSRPRPDGLKPLTTYDPPSLHLVKKGQETATVEQAKREGKLTKARAEVWECCVHYPGANFTAKDLEAQFGIGYHKIQKRLGELRIAGLIELTGEKRDNCAIYVLSKDCNATP